MKVARMTSIAIDLKSMQAIPQEKLKKKGGTHKLIDLNAALFF